MPSPAFFLARSATKPLHKMSRSVFLNEPSNLKQTSCIKPCPHTALFSIFLITRAPLTFVAGPFQKS